MSCDTIFIQHNGLIKIGSIAPDIVNQHVKTCIDKVWWSKNAHFMAPELKEIYNNSDSAASANLSTASNQSTASSNLLQPPVQQLAGNNLSVNTTAAVDIYAFGMVALEVGFNLNCFHCSLFFCWCLEWKFYLYIYMYIYENIWIFFCLIKNKKQF